MRLTCPNCGAQYEVPDEVIPQDGRDVQCSNCGDTWFQAHPDNPDTGPDTGLGTDPDADADVGSDPAPEPDPVPQASEPEAPEPDPTPETSEPEEPERPESEAPKAQDADAIAEAPEAPQDTPAPQHQEIDSGISDILRQEAERETQLRAADSGDALESQPDLGLDNMPGDETSQRAREVRDRMARMRGETGIDPEVDAGSRRELLPDIEEINSTLRASDESGATGTTVGPAHVGAAKKRGGFARGFLFIVVIGLFLAVVYFNAAKIVAAIPQTEPMMNAYVGMVDQGRVWLDARLGDLIPNPEE